MIKKCLFLFCCLSVLSLAGCGSGGSSDSSGGDSSTDDGFVSVSYQSLCGAVQNNVLVNPVTQAERVSVEPVSSDTVIVTRKSGPQEGMPQLIKLHGITSTGVEDRLVNLGIQLIDREIGSTGYLVLAGDGCVATTTGGGQGALGQIFDNNGENINESLIETGAALPIADTCGGDQLASCYQGLDVSEPTSPYTVGKFLWKPVSESTGNLACLTDTGGVFFTVRGAITEELSDQGSAAGYGSLGRAKHPGCSYGSNVKVYLTDMMGRRVLTNAGDEYISIPNGCSRVERNY